jgi:hypothetical protein
VHASYKEAGGVTGCAAAAAAGGVTSQCWQQLMIDT